MSNIPTTLKERISKEIKLLGSQEAVAKKCGISGTALSQYLSGKYGADIKTLEQKILHGLSAYEDGSWRIVQTRDFVALQQAFRKAKEKSIFIAVSEAAGSGKTACVKDYGRSAEDVYVLFAKEWTGRMFLEYLMRTLGMEVPKGYLTMDEKLERICSFFKARHDRRCQLIIDEADKLRPSALRTLIPLYNECEGFLSVVICGTEHLAKEIKRGVAYSKKGYDEIDSRFGREYLPMFGCFKKDVQAICEANGITEEERVDKIWVRCKTRTTIEGKDYEVVKEIRTLKRVIVSNQLS